MKILKYMCLVLTLSVQYCKTNELLSENYEILPGHNGQQMSPKPIPYYQQHGINPYPQISQPIQYPHQGYDPYQSYHSMMPYSSYPYYSPFHQQHPQHVPSYPTYPTYPTYPRYESYPTYPTYPSYAPQYPNNYPSYPTISQYPPHDVQQPENITSDWPYPPLPYPSAQVDPIQPGGAKPEVIYEDYDIDGKLISSQTQFKPYKYEKMTIKYNNTDERYAAEQNTPYVNHTRTVSYDNPRHISRVEKSYSQSTPQWIKRVTSTLKNTTTTIVQNTLIRPNKKPEIIVHIYRDPSEGGNVTMINPDMNNIQVNTVIENGEVIMTNSTGGEASEAMVEATTVSSTRVELGTTKTNVLEDEYDDEEEEEEEEDNNNGFDTTTSTTPSSMYSWLRGSNDEVPSTTSTTTSTTEGYSFFG